GVVGGRGEVVEDLVDRVDVRDLAQPDAHHLRARHHHGGAVFLAGEADELELLPGDLLHIHAGDAADPLVRIDHAVPDAQAAVADADLSLVDHLGRTPFSSVGEIPPALLSPHHL